MRDYNICYSLDSNYTEQLLVSVASILKNAEETENFNFYILDGGLQENDKKLIEALKKIKNFNVKFISVNNEDFAVCPLLKYKSEHYKNYHVTLPTYFRFKLAEYLSDIKNVLYLDCDVIVRKSLKELFATDLQNTSAVMIEDVEGEKEAKRLNLNKYFNAGVMLINLEFWRQNKISAKLFEYSKNNKNIIQWQDQDVLNVVLKESVKELDSKWNFQYFLYDNVDLKDLQDSSILHLSGRFKPWLMPFEHPVYDLYYYYLGFTGLKNRVVFYKQNSFGKFLKNNLGGSETNIRLVASDEDISKVYEEISKSYEKLEKVYDSLKENYDFAEARVKECEEKLQRETDEKFEKVYAEVKDNYDFAEARVKECEEKLQRETDEKFEKVYTEVKDNYDFAEARVKECEEKLQRETDEKFEKVYTEVKDNYDFAEVRVKECEEKLQRETDEKFEKVYSEIKDNYDFAKSKAEECEEKFQRETDEKFEKIYEEIKENYDFTKKAIFDSKYDITCETDGKFTPVYEEITKNYKYTENLANNIKNELQSGIDENKVYMHSQLNKLSNIYDKLAVEKTVIENTVEGLQKQVEEIQNECVENKNAVNLVKDDMKRTASYLDFLVKSESAKHETEFVQKIDEIKNKFENKIALVERNTADLKSQKEEFEKRYEVEKGYIYTDISDRLYLTKQEVLNTVNKIIDDLYLSSDEKIQNIKKEIEEKFHKSLAGLNEDIQKDYKILSTRVNEVETGFYKEVDKNNKNIENTFSCKVNGVYSVTEEIKSSLEYIKSVVEQKAYACDLQAIEDKLNAQADDMKLLYEQTVNALKNECDEKLNKQRCTYERKLIKMEEKIAALQTEIAKRKRNPIAELIEKFRKTKESENETV